MGDESRLYAAGAYILLIFSGIAVLLLRKNDSYAKFHAMQSILFTVALIVLSVALGIAGGIVGLIPFLGWITSLIFFAIAGLANLAVFLLWLYLMWKAYTGERFMLPVIGAEAEKMAKKA
jgi:uncharacterized membrane protein